MIILYDLIDFIEMIRIKEFALYAEVSLSAFVLATSLSWRSVG